MTKEAEDAYLKGFAEKCAEYGVSPEELQQWAKEAGFWEGLGNIGSGLWEGAKSLASDAYEGIGNIGNRLTGGLGARVGGYFGNMMETGSHADAAQAASQAARPYTPMGQYDAARTAYQQKYSLPQVGGVGNIAKTTPTVDQQKKINSPYATIWHAPQNYYGQGDPRNSFWAG